MMTEEHNDKNTNISFLKKKIKEFVKERDWTKFHYPKGLAISISLESAELLELFQWKDKENLEVIKKNENLMKKLQEEIADILIYALSFSNQLDIDLTSAVINKLNKNNEKYPKELVKGKAKKYTHYMEVDKYG
jgi:NTP pyrophosphatase (non-canonical NTP hydrolase)